MSGNYSQAGDASNTASSNAIYHDKPPAVVLFGKAFALVTVVMVLIAIVIAILEVHRDWAFSLLIINLVLSSTVTLFLAYWYKKEDLDSSKMWFVFVTAGILIFQCLTTIIYVTAHKTIADAVTPAPAFTKVAPVTVKPPPP